MSPLFNIMINKTNMQIIGKMDASSITVGPIFKKNNMIINADKYKEDLVKRVNGQFKKDFHEYGKVASVMIINASSDPANDRYISQKKKLLDSFGVRCFVKKFNDRHFTGDIQQYIKETQGNFDAVMIQSPVYEHIDYEKLIQVVDFTKDIDGLHPINQGLLYSKQKNALLPCTALGVYSLMDLNDIDINKKNVVIIGRGKLVADPLAKMLENHDCTVTKIHTKTDSEYRDRLIKDANIIVSCTGRDLRHIINPETVGSNLEALIGVGFRYEDGKQLQDFDCNAEWNYEVKVTSNTNATGTATVCALVDNLLQIKNI